MEKDEDVIGHELAALVREQLTRYIAFHSDRFDAEADACTLWVMMTHTLDAFDTTPYLYVTAPTPEAGKSRIIDVAKLLVARPHVVIDPTPASLFRLIDAERPTIFIDEADELTTNKPLRALLNAGFQRGGFVPRGQGKFMVKYDVYCAKLVSGIKGKRLPLKGATLSRCIEIPMRTRLLDGSEPIAEFHEADVRRDTDGLRTSLEAWGPGAVAGLAESRPAMPSWLSDRQRDGWGPLVAIADRLGGDWPLAAREAAHVLKGARRPDEGTQLIADVRSAWEYVQDRHDKTGKRVVGTTFEDGQVVRAWSQTLLEVMKVLDDRQFEGNLSPRQFTTWLQRFDIRPLPSGFTAGGATKRRGYERAAFEDAFKRYTAGTLSDPDKKALEA